MKQTPGGATEIGSGRPPRRLVALALEDGRAGCPVQVADAHRTVHLDLALLEWSGATGENDDGVLALLQVEGVAPTQLEHLADPATNHDRLILELSRIVANAVDRFTRVHGESHDEPTQHRHPRDHE